MCLGCNSAPRLKQKASGKYVSFSATSIRLKKKKKKVSQCHQPSNRLERTTFKMVDRKPGKIAKSEF